MAAAGIGKIGLGPGNREAQILGEIDTLQAHGEFADDVGDPSDGITPAAAAPPRRSWRAWPSGRARVCR